MYSRIFTWRTLVFRSVTLTAIPYMRHLLEKEQIGLSSFCTFCDVWHRHAFRRTLPTSIKGALESEGHPKQHRNLRLLHGWKTDCRFSTQIGPTHLAKTACKRLQMDYVFGLFFIIFWGERVAALTEMAIYRASTHPLNPIMSGRVASCVFAFFPLAFCSSLCVV